jgi:hypothetical protein
MDLRLAINTILQQNASTVKMCAQSHANKSMTALAAVVDGALATPIALAYPPARHSFVHCTVNSEIVIPGNGAKDSALYFSGDGGVTARLIAEIQQGDLLYWMRSLAGYDLAPTDRISIFYEVWQ